MSKIKLLRVVLLLPLMALTLSGCTLSLGTGSNTGSGGATDGGVFKSLNKGGNWAQKTLIQSVGAKRSFAAVDIISLAFDPSDHKAIYAGSLANGLFYSYDGAEGWQVAAGLGKVA